MTGTVIIQLGDREHGFMADDLIVNAIERVVTRRLASGGSMFLSAAAMRDTGRDHMTVMLTPATPIQFSYSDLGEHANENAGLQATIDLLRRHVELHGGICLDENDLPVEPT